MGESNPLDDWRQPQRPIIFASVKKTDNPDPSAVAAPEPTCSPALSVPLLWPLLNACLLNSLALNSFLVKHKIWDKEQDYLLTNMLREYILIILTTKEKW